MQKHRLGFVPGRGVLDRHLVPSPTRHDAWLVLLGRVGKGEGAPSPDRPIVVVVVVVVAVVVVGGVVVVLLVGIVAC